MKRKSNVCSGVKVINNTTHHSRSGFVEKGQEVINSCSWMRRDGQWCIWDMYNGQGKSFFTALVPSWEIQFQFFVSVAWPKKISEAESSRLSLLRNKSK